MTRVAIVGAGVAGLTVAYGLRTLPVEVTVFEKSRGYGGRAATRGRYGSRYDHGASYFAPLSERSERLVTEYLPTDGLVNISRGIWTFDREGALERPPPNDHGTPKWTYREGISKLGKLLARFSQADLHTETRIQEIERIDEGWVLWDATQTRHAHFDALVLTPPAPQTAALLASGERTGERRERVKQVVDSVEYASQFSYVFAYDRPLSRPGNFFGLMSSDGEHPLSWVGFEHDKPGHVPAGHSMVIVHTAPDWTAPRLDRDPDEFVPDVKEWAEDLLVTDLRHPAWYDVQRWRYARPLTTCSPDPGLVGEDLQLFLAGDYMAGEGRVGDALETGIDVAVEVREQMDF